MKIKKLDDQVIAQLSQENVKKYNQATTAGYHEILSCGLPVSLA